MILSRQRNAKNGRPRRLPVAIKCNNLVAKNVKKINYLTPETVVLIKTQLEKSKFKKIRILLDSGSSGSIILEKFVHKLHMKNDATTIWTMKGGNFQTSQKCNTTFILNELFKNKSIEWNLHVDSTPGPHRYDMILGRDVLSELGITLDFIDQTMTWDDSTMRMKDPESFLDLLDPINDFFWSIDHYERQRRFKKLPLVSRKF